jgi:hypothetical protein
VTSQSKLGVGEKEQGEEKRGRAKNEGVESAALTQAHCI